MNIELIQLENEVLKKEITKVKTVNETLLNTLGLIRKNSNSHNEFINTEIDNCYHKITEILQKQ